MGRKATIHRGRPLRLLLAAGGTGGHVIPAIVVAREFCRRDPSRQVLFVGTASGVESRLVPEAGYALLLLRIGSLQGQSFGSRFRTLVHLPRALWQAFRYLEQFQPDVVLGVGGYAAGPMMLAAAFRGVPLAVLEPNAYPGLANRWVAPYVSRAFLEFSETASFFPYGSSRQTGIPVREEFFSVPRKERDSSFSILVFGGSQGARSLNRAVLAALPRLAQSLLPLSVVHQTGQSAYNEVRDEAEKYSSNASLRLLVSPYLEKMWEAFSAADLVICRAGASTIAELGASARAAILVPFPSAANQHQLRNGEALVRMGAAHLILDSELNGDTLEEAIQTLRTDPVQLLQMQHAVHTLAHPHAAVEITNELESIVPMGAGLHKI